MKSFKYLSSILSVLLFLFSCNKQLDLPNDGRITMDDVFSDYNRTRGYLNACYGFEPDPYMDRASFSDEAEDADDFTAGSRYNNWYSGNVTSQNYASNSADGSPWGKLYEGIRKCNVFIESMKTATVYATEEEKAGWVAQARTLRALYYLQLIKRYGSVPIFDKPLEIGHDFSKDSKSSFSEVTNFIISDCDSALLVPDTENGFHWAIYDNQFGIMTRAIAYAIKSEAATYAASPLWSDGTYTWEKATAINSEALAQLLSNDYKLFDDQPAPTAAQNAYALYFITTSNDRRSYDKETIYQGGNQMQVWKNAGLPSTEGSVKAGPCPSQELIDSYEMANGQMPVSGYADADHLQPIINSASGYDAAHPYEGRDPRFYASIYYNGAPRVLTGGNTTSAISTLVGGAEGISSTSSTNKYTRTGYYLRKFNNYLSGANNDADGAVRLFRLGEIYLNFAESAYQSAGPDAVISANGLNLSARDAVNKIRARAGMPVLPAGLPTEEFQKRYRNERRVELAFEEHRFFDVRRWKILEQTDQVVTGMRITKSGDNLSYTRFKFTNRNSATDKWLMYPIDQSEVNKIIGLGGENWQNPGWFD